MNPMSLMRVVVVFSFLALPLWSHAATISLFASLDGLQEVPANPSPGTGTAWMTYDDVTNQLNWNINFSGLVAGVNNAHFHGPAAPGVSAGAAIAIPWAPVAGQTSGTLIGMATLTATQETQLLSDLWYVNIHTTYKPGGEIRGQVQVVPIPAAAWLFGSGLLGLIGVAKRKNAA